MNSAEVDTNQEDQDAGGAASETASAGEGKAKQPLQQEVQVTEPSSCERHITVIISREDVDRYLDDAISELLPKAEIPGFRPGRAPRKLIESRFRDQVRDQVKGSLLMDSMAQVNETHKFTAISEPSFDLDSVNLPDEGPLKYEFDLEVRPDFTLPEWKGLQLKRPVHEYSDDDVDRHFARVMERYSEREPVEGPAAENDFVKVHATFRVGDEVLSEHRDLELRARKTISFRDGQIEDGLGLLVGCQPGDRRQAALKISGDAESAHAGKDATLEIEVEQVTRSLLPSMTSSFLDEIGGFSSSDEVKAFLRNELQRQFGFQQRKQIRQQIASVLTKDASWDLPPELLRRQARRELDRAVLELKRNGFSDDQIRSYANQLRQNSLSVTRTALKEHFILERIAEQEQIEATPEDYDVEIKLIADQSDESERRVRARLEKRGQMDSLRNQIVERKVIELISEAARFTDVPWEPHVQQDFAVDIAVCTAVDESEIPAAKHGESGGDTQKPADERK